MAKKGRPFVYQSDTEKPVTVSVRLPRDLYDRVERYVKMHPGMTLTEFFLDGAQLRLDTPTDPRDLILSDDNTVIQEVQEMIRAAVQAEIGKLRDFMGPRFSAPGDMPAPEVPAPPLPDISYNDNTVLQKDAPRGAGKRGAMRQRILTLLGEHPEGLSAEHIRVYLQAKKPLGDTLQGMVRQSVIEKQGSGKAVRYRVVGTQGTDTRARRSAGP
jgi:hypothetical protein